MEWIVKFRRGGDEGVVIDEYHVDSDGKNPTHFFSSEWPFGLPVDASEEDKERARRERLRRTRYDVRLDNGMIIREVRDWEVVHQNPM